LKKLFIIKLILLLCLGYFCIPITVIGGLNKGQLYEAHLKELLKSKRLLPESLNENDAGFIHHGKIYYLEIKNKTASDFGQKGLIWDQATGWRWRHKDIISDLYDQFGVIQHIDKDFVPRRHSVVPKEQITKADKSYDQQHFEKRGIPLDNNAYLYEYYARKNCFYIQIEGLGFYYLKADPAKLGVPQFSPRLTLRLRAKTHHSTPVYQYSFFAVIQINRRKIPPSPYDLEEKVGGFPLIKKIENE